MDRRRSQEQYVGVVKSLLNKEKKIINSGKALNST